MPNGHPCQGDLTLAAGMVSCTLRLCPTADMGVANPMRQTCGDCASICWRAVKLAQFRWKCSMAHT